MKTDELIQALKAAKEAFEKERTSENKVHNDAHQMDIKSEEDEMVVEIIKTKVTYDDVTMWVKTNIRPNYDGFYMHHSRAKFLDKGDFLLNICFSKNMEPQTDKADPVVTFIFDKMDETLNNMLSDKSTILVKIK